MAGAGISWLKDKLQLFGNTDECETLAASVPHTAGKPLSILPHPMCTVAANCGKAGPHVLPVQVMGA